MNEFMINQQVQPQSTSTSNSHGRRGKGDSGVDFSSLVSKASNPYRSEKSVVPRESKSVAPKDSEVKPPEELVAYASASQAANNPAPVSETTTEPADIHMKEISAQNAAVASYSVEDKLASVLGTDDLQQVLDILGIEMPENLTDEDAADFAATLVALINEKLGAITETQQVAAVSAIRDVSGLDGDALMRDAIVRQRIRDVGRANMGLEPEPRIITEKTAEELQADLLNKHGIGKITPIASAAASGIAMSVINDETAVVDEDMPELTVAKGDATVKTAEDLLSNVKAKLETHIAAQQMKADNTSETDFAKAVTANDEAIPEEPEAQIETKNTVAVRGENNFVNLRTASVETVVQTQTTEAHVDIRNVIDQIVQSAKMTRADGLSQLEIQLRPEHLGKVSIVFTNGEDGVSAQIKANNDTVRAMLGGGLGDLMNSLKDMGINMKNINVAEPEMNWDYTRNAGQQQQFGREGQNRDNNNEQSRPNSRILRVNNPSLAQISTTLYGTTALQPIMDENVSIDFIA